MMRLEGSQLPPADNSDVMMRHSVALAGNRLRGLSLDASSYLPTNISSRAASLAPTPYYREQQVKTSSMWEGMSALPIIPSGGRESFPMVLHRALAQLELIEGGTSVATFMPDGKSFQVRNQFLLEKQVLPFFFPKMKGFPSFQRQLNLYDFKRIGGAGIDRGAYHHELFVRDRPQLSCEMKRTKIKGSSRTKRVRSQSESAAESAPAPSAED
mmetsp:Transcript_1826/g.2842  ORF Transcript_1826/g.2842 Transcript_1826/m.2842 type:complete len:213 (-) Transcript_1826:284-922(-)